MNHRKSWVVTRSASGVLPAVIALVVAYGVIGCSTAPRRTAAERAADGSLVG
jgi:hypothetical protein